MPGASFHGLLVIDKPSGLTSRAAVDRAKGWFPRGTRLGHTGTLDPLATGVLVLCIGAATRLTDYVQRMEKVYRTVLRLGARSSTDDADGEVVAVPVETPPLAETISAILPHFVGDIEQIPPAYSAAKIQGRRAYALARKGLEVELGPRRVRIHEIRLLDYQFPRLQLEVRCSKGTYIRSLARDLGERLGCGALVETLRRVRVGFFDESAAIPLDTDPAVARSRLLSLAAAVVELPRIVLGQDDLTRLQCGQTIPLDSTSGYEIQETGVFDDAGQLRAVALVEPSRKSLRPVKVFME